MRFASLALLLAGLASAVADQPAEPGRRAGSKARTDADLVEGTWLIVGLEAGGKAEPEANYRGNTLTFTKDKATLKEGKHAPIEFAWALDPTKSPGAIDLTAKAVTIRGVYRFDGDDLTLCLSIGPNRPTDFATRAGGDTEVFTLKRSRWERYSDKASGFGVDMPGRPEERKRDATTVQVVRSEAERVTYLVAVTPVAGPPEEKAAEAALDATRAALLAEAAGPAKATVESERTFKVGPATVRELTIGLEVDWKDKVGARVRLFAAGDRAFGLMVAGPEEGVRAANTGRFWNSFRLAGEKKKN
ncbi:TIGR03067 domain-containing protein [Gemmata sp.]|uniref:TIGR03067 domain-containing protein n=1 Tax=Gemmata sp. TaxID=1914242 RepID=UPI003F720509